MNADWFRGEPVRTWMRDRTEFPVIGRLLVEDWMVYPFSYAGLLFDLLVFPMLLWRRTRALAFVAAVLFHVANDQLFQIGIFPWLAIATTALYFPPDWPRRLIGIAGVRAKPWGRVRGSPARNPEPALPAGRYVTATLLGLYLAVQILLPLRHPCTRAR
jgi:hypothetical protein